MIWLECIIVLVIVLSLSLWGSFATLATFGGCGLAVWFATVQLGGMSGDISGFALTLGELCGILVLVLVG